MTSTSRTRRRLLALARLTVALTIAAFFLLLLTNSLQDNDSYASIGSGICAFVALFAWLFDHLRRQEPVPPLDEASEDLRLRLLDECDAELHRRVERFPNQKTIPLEWRKYRGSGPSPLDGRFEGDPEEAATRLAERFDLPSGRKRMVVLGEPGAGKTFMALSLTVGLLRRWTGGKPVAVYLSLSTWDPVVDDLDTWIVDTIAKTYYLGEQRTPRALLNDRRLLPVLDGLDELAEHLRRLAVQLINESLTADRMLVVTCRTAEYEDVLTGGAPDLLRAPAVEVRPVTANDLVTRLRSVEAWKDVAQRVEDHPDGPLATALSTPLMLSLFTANYLDSDPAVLLDQTRFANKHAVERHLVDFKLDAAYPQQAPRESWNARRARKWLTFLAQHMHEYDEREITWRKLAYRVIPTATSLIVATAVSAGLLWWGTLNTFDAKMDLDKLRIEAAHATSTIIDSGPLTALAFSALTCALWLSSRRFRTPRSPDRNSRVTGFKRGATVGFVTVLPVGLFLAFLSSRWFSYSQTVDAVALMAEVFALALVCAVAVGLHEMIAERTTTELVTRSAWDGVRQERVSTLLAAVTAGLVVGTLSVPASVMASSLGSHLGQRLAISFGHPSVADIDLPPLTVYSEWEFTPVVLMRLIYTSVLIALLFAVMLATTRAWSRFLMARVWLASTGRLPWRLQEFLDDATQRRLLRRVGMGYQFSHALLQDRLVSPDAAHEPTPHRTRARVAVTVAAIVVLTAVTGVVWSGSPAGCRETPWAQVNNRLARVQDGPDTACFAVLAQDDATFVQNQTDVLTLSRLLATRPEGPLSGGGSVLVAGELDQISPGRWHDILVGLDAARRVADEFFVVELAFADFERTRGTEAVNLTALYLETTASQRYYNPQRRQRVVLALDVDTSPTSYSYVVGVNDPALATRAKEKSESAVKDWLLKAEKGALPSEAVTDGVSADECATMKKLGPSRGMFDLRKVRPTPKLLDDIAACGSAEVLVKQEDKDALAVAPIPRGIGVVYMSNEWATITPNCVDALGADANAENVKTCVAAVTVAESYRVELKSLRLPF